MTKQEMVAFLASFVMDAWEKLPRMTCQECGKTIVIVQPMYEIQLEITAKPILSCSEHD